MDLMLGAHGYPGAFKGGSGTLTASSVAGSMGSGDWHPPMVSGGVLILTDGAASYPML